MAVAAVLGALAVHSHWRPNQWLLSDGLYYLHTAQGWLERASLRQEGVYPASWVERDLGGRAGWNADGSVAASGASLGNRGEWWPKHPVLMPICAAPFVWALGAAGALLFQFLTMCLLAWFTYRVAARVASAPAAWVASLAVVATPFFFGQAWGFNNDAFSALFVLAALDATLGDRPLAAGLFAGAAVLAKPTGLLYLPAVAAWFLLARDWKGLGRAAAGAALPLATLGALNAHMFGSLFVTAYQRVLVRQAGQLTAVSAGSELLWREWPARLVDVLFGDQQVLPRAPLLLLALAALPVVVLRAPRARSTAVLGYSLGVPILFLAPHAYFRLDYLLAQVGLSAAVLAMAARPQATAVTAPVKTWRRKRIAQVAGAAVAGILVLGLGRRALAHPSANALWDRVREARVFLGDTPCDFFDDGTERWECRGADVGVLAGTGRLLQPPRFDGREEARVLLSPHPAGARRLELDGVKLGRRLVLRYGFADSEGRGATTHLAVELDGAAVVDQTLVGPGSQATEMDTSSRAGTRGRLVFTVPAGAPAVFGVSAEVR